MAVTEVFDNAGNLLSRVDTDPNGNEATIRAQAAAALAANRAYVASTPSAAATTAQVKALSRQTNSIIRLLLNQLDATD